MKKNKLIVFIILIVLVLIIVLFLKYNNSIWKNVPNTLSSKNTSLISYLSKVDTKNSSWSIEEAKKIFWNEIEDYNNNINSWDFLEAIKNSDNIIKYSENNNPSNIWPTNEDSKKVIKAASKYLKVGALLFYGNSYYKEKEYWEMAEKELNNIQIIDEDLLNNPYWMYYLWYSKEIQRNYTEALDYYKKALEYCKNDRYIYAVISNQMWHLFDLMWDTQNANIFYKYSYEANSWSVNINMNIWRSLLKDLKFNEALVFFEEALKKTDNNLIKSEIYYNISSIYFYWANPDKDYLLTINKSLEFANKSLEASDKYPLSYLWVARVLILQNKDLTRAEELLNKSIKLYPKLSLSYEYLWFLFQQKNELNKSNINFKLSLDNLKSDITLMASDLPNIQWRLNYYLAYNNSLLLRKDDAINNIQAMINSESKLANIMFIKECKGKDYWTFWILKNEPYFKKLMQVLNINN